MVLEDWPVLPPGGGRFLDDLGSWKPSALAALAGLGEAERPDRGDLDLDLEWRGMGEKGRVKREDRSAAEGMLCDGDDSGRGLP